MKAMLSAVVAALLFAAAGAQEISRVSLSERVRALLAESGVEVGVAADTPAPASRAHRELKLTWEADKAALPAPAAVQYKNAKGRVALAQASVSREGGLPRQRSAELSPTQVVVVALDAAGRMRWCGLITDPRLLRAELPGPDGELSGQVIYKESAEFVLQYPDDDAVTEVRLYHPDWDGQKFSLELVGAVAPR